MANKRIIELQERTSIDMGDWLIVDSSTSTRKLSLATLFNYMTLTSMIFVTELPTTDISESTIYLVPHSGSTTDWDEYIYRDNEWIQIGTSTIDLSAIYQTKTDNNLQTTSKQIVGAINEVKTGLGNKVNASGSLTDSNKVLLNSYRENSPYTTPTDGYLNVLNTASTKGVAYIKTSTDHIIVGSKASEGWFTTYVKKGTNIYCDSSFLPQLAYFYPVTY